MRAGSWILPCIKCQWSLHILRPIKQNRVLLVYTLEVLSSQVWALLLCPTQGSSLLSVFLPSPPLFPPRSTSDRRSVSRVLLPYKFSSRRANRRTLITAIISDSNYLQIYAEEEERSSDPGLPFPLPLEKNHFTFAYIYLRPLASNFNALKPRYLERLGWAPSSVCVGTEGKSLPTALLCWDFDC